MRAKGERNGVRTVSAAYCMLRAEILSELLLERFALCTEHEPAPVVGQVDGHDDEADLEPLDGDRLGVDRDVVGSAHRAILA